MSGKSQLVERHGHEAIVVERPDDQAFLAEEDDRQRRERTIAKFRLLLTHRSLLLRAAAMGFVASALLAFLIPKKYTSTARLMPPDSQSSSGLQMAAAALKANGSGIGAMAGDLLGVTSSSDLFVGILSSRTVADGLIQKFDLRSVYSDRRMEDARRDLAERTGISVDRKSQIITVSVTDRSPQRSAAMAQAYVEQLDHLVAELSTSSARRERIFLEGRLQGVTRDLETAEKEFSQFASKNTAIDVKEQGKAMVDAAAAVQGELIATQSELEGLKQIYTENNVRVRSLTARVTKLQQELEMLADKDGGAQTASDAKGGSFYPSIRQLPLLGVPYEDFYRRTKVQEAVFETLTQEYEMAKVEEAKEIPTVKVLDPADVPDKQSFPPRLPIVLVGTMLAILIGVAWVFVSASWRTTAPSDPGKQFAQEVWDIVGTRLPLLFRNGSDPLALDANSSEGLVKHPGDSARVK